MLYFSASIYSPNLKFLSIEPLLPSEDTAVIWRGPIKHSAIRQFIGDIDWGDLDYLVIDAQKIAKHFNKTIPNTKEKFLVKFYIQGANLDNFIDEEFGVLGIEGFGTWVSLHNSKKIEFEMEIK